MKQLSRTSQPWRAQPMLQDEIKQVFDRFFQLGASAPLLRHEDLEHVDVNLGCHEK